MYFTWTSSSVSSFEHLTYRTSTIQLFMASSSLCLLLTQSRLKECSLRASILHFSVWHRNEKQPAVTFPASSPPSLNTLPKGKVLERLSISAPLRLSFKGTVFTAHSVYFFIEEQPASVLTVESALRKFRSLSGGKSELNMIASLPLLCELVNNIWVLISGSRGGLH